MNQNIDQSSNIVSKNSINLSHQRTIQEELNSKTQSRNQRSVSAPPADVVAEEDFKPVKTGTDVWTYLQNNVIILANFKTYQRETIKRINVQKLWDPTLDITKKFAELDSEVQTILTSLASHNYGWLFWTPNVKEWKDKIVPSQFGQIIIARMRIFNIKQLNIRGINYDASHIWKKNLSGAEETTQNDQLKALFEGQNSNDEGASLQEVFNAVYAITTKVPEPKIVASGSGGSVLSRPIVRISNNDAANALIREFKFPPFKANTQDQWNAWNITKIKINNQDYNISALKSFDFESVNDIDGITDGVVKGQLEDLAKDKIDVSLIWTATDKAKYEILFQAFKSDKDGILTKLKKVKWKNKFSQKRDGYNYQYSVEEIKKFDFALINNFDDIANAKVKSEIISLANGNNYSSQISKTLGPHYRQELLIDQLKLPENKTKINDKIKDLEIDTLKINDKDYKVNELGSIDFNTISDSFADVSIRFSQKFFQLYYLAADDITTGQIITAIGEFERIDNLAQTLWTNLKLEARLTNIKTQKINPLSGVSIPELSNAVGTETYATLTTSARKELRTLANKPNIVDNIDEAINPGITLWNALDTNGDLARIKDYGITAILGVSIPNLKDAVIAIDYADQLPNIKTDLIALKVKSPAEITAEINKIIDNKAKALWTTLKGSDSLTYIQSQNMLSILDTNTIRLHTLQPEDNAKDYEDLDSTIQDVLKGLVKTPDTQNAIDAAVLNSKTLDLWETLKASDSFTYIQDNNIQTIDGVSIDNLEALVRKDVDYGNLHENVKTELKNLIQKPITQAAIDAAVLDLKATALWETLKASDSFTYIQTNDIKTILEVSIDHLEALVDKSVDYAALGQNIQTELKNLVKKPITQIQMDAAVLDLKATALWESLKVSDSFNYIQDNNIQTIDGVSINGLEALVDKSVNYGTLEENVKTELKNLIQKPITQAAIDAVVLDLKATALWETLKVSDSFTYIQTNDIETILEVSIDHLEALVDKSVDYAALGQNIQTELKNLVKKPITQIQMDAVVLDLKATVLWESLKTSDSFTYIQDENIQTIDGVSINGLEALVDKSVNYGTLEENVKDELKNLIQKPITQIQMDAVVLELKTKALWTSFIENDSLTYLKDNSIDTILGIPIPELKTLDTKAATYETEEDEIKDELKLLAAKGNNPQELIDNEVLDLKATALWETLKVSDSFTYIQDENIQTIDGVSINGLEALVDKNLNYGDLHANVKTELKALIQKPITQAAIDAAVLDLKATALWDTLKDSNSLTYIQDNKIENIIDVNIPNVKALTDKSKTYDTLGTDIQNELKELVKTPQTQDAIDNAVLKKLWSDLNQKKRLEKIQLYQENPLLDINIPLLAKIDKTTKFDALSKELKEELKKLLTKDGLLNKIDDQLIALEQKAFKDSDDLIKDFQKENSILDTLEKLKKDSFYQTKDSPLSVKALLKIKDWSKVKSAKDLTPEAIQELKQISKSFANKKGRVEEIKLKINDQAFEVEDKILPDEAIIAISSVLGFFALLIIIFFTIRFLRKRQAPKNKVES